MSATPANGNSDPESEEEDKDVEGDIDDSRDTESPKRHTQDEQHEIKYGEVEHSEVLGEGGHRRRVRWHDHQEQEEGWGPEAGEEEEEELEELEGERLEYEEGQGDEYSEQEGGSLLQDEPQGHASLDSSGEYQASNTSSSYQRRVGNQDHQNSLAAPAPAPVTLSSEDRLIQKKVLHLLAHIPVTFTHELPLLRLNTSSAVRL